MRRVGWIALVCLAALGLRAQDPPAEKKPALSPDKKWEYRVINGETVALVKAGEDKPAIELSSGEMLKVESGKLVWAPDSRRFAFNFRAGGKYYSFEVYELAGNTWQKLPDAAENAEAVSRLIERSEREQLKKLHPPKGATPNSVMDKWQVRRWLDDDTYEATANSESRVVIDKKTEDLEYFGAAVVFTVKCDNRGGWKVISSRLFTKADQEKFKEDED
jgi:hypothetical protein